MGLCVAVAAGSALGFSSRLTPTYEAKAKVFVGPRTIEKGDDAGLYQELTMAQQYVTSYAEILKSRPLAEKVVQDTNAPISASQLANRTRTKILPETRLIEVTVTDESPARAQLYVNQLVNTFVEDKDGQFGGGGGVAASVLEHALRPTYPVSPKPLQNGVIGGLLGLMLGVGAAFLLEQLDTTLRTKEDVERVLAPLPVIATIPLAPLAKEWDLFMESSPNSPQSEAIRILRTNIQFFSVDRPIRRVLVTSPFASDGKTTVATNLAAGIAATGSNVLLIETDLRKPVVRQYFDAAGIPGLSDVLSGQAELRQAIMKSRIPNLSIVVAGPTPPNPSELLGSERMASLLDSASEMFDIVILDTPPALPVTDASILAPHTDGVILVVRAGQTQSNKAQDVTRNFDRLGVRVLGIAVNALERDADGGYYYHYQYAHQPLPGDGERRRTRGFEPDSDFDDFVVSNVKPAALPTAPAPVREEVPSSTQVKQEEEPIKPAAMESKSSTINASEPTAPESVRTPDDSRTASFRARLRDTLGEMDVKPEVQENGRKSSL